MRSVVLAVAAAGLLVSLPMGPVRADDAGIPARCRPKEADDGRCADLIEVRSAERNARLNRRDSKANADVRLRILASRTATGETVSDVFDRVAQRVAFVVSGWDFVYARSGADYAVVDYGLPAAGGKARRDASQARTLLDYDLDTDPVDSLRNSQAEGFVVWKVEGGAFVPWGRYANMLALGSGAFTWAVNDGRKGFSGSGYDDRVARDFSFMSGLPAGQSTLADAVPTPDGDLTLYWNVVDGYVAQADGLPCPPRTVGSFTLRGRDCEAKAAAAADISGSVLPFRVIRAVRSHSYQRGMVAADVSVSVEGGMAGDWLATAAYVAEHAVVGDVTFATVSVFVPNPWADFPPQRVKLLARAYYGPDPSRSPWKERWTLLGSRGYASKADIEYDELSNDLIEDPGKIPDPDRRLQRASDAARRAVIARYGLPRDWKPTTDLGLDGTEHDRDHVAVTGPVPGDASLAELTRCLTTEDGNAVVQGCVPSRP